MPQDASTLITRYIEGLSDWRGKVMARLRTLIGQAAPELHEDWKWNTPVWSHRGNVVAIGAFKDHIKVNFFKGAALPDPRRVFNAGFDAKTSRSIDIHEGDRIDGAALQALVRAAVLVDSGTSAAAKPRGKR